MVREFTDTVGALPLSASGRPLQEVLSGSPQLRFVGSKPSSIYLSLTSSVPEKRVVSPTPKRNTKGRLKQKYTYMYMYVERISHVM